MMWVLRKKGDKKGKILRYKTRAVVCGNQQKRKALASGSEHTLETFAPAARSATFKLLCAVGCIANRRVRHFDVDAAYLQGSFEGDDGKVHVRPSPPDERHFNNRGIPFVRKLLKPLYGEAQAGRIWHRTAKRQLTEIQGFTHQYEFDPCYFFKKYDDEHRADLALYVDDCWMADTGSLMADDDVRIFQERFKLTVQMKLKQFLGMNIDMDAQGGVQFLADAYIKPLAEYPHFDTLSSPQLVKNYKIAAQKEHHVDPAFQKKYQSNVGALIYSPPCRRPGKSLTIGILARALTFPTPEMDEHANRVLAYMAQTAEAGIEFKKGGLAELAAYSDSDSQNFRHSASV
eukprot:5298245-Pleurochrysis_carterae.AAC.1